MIHNSANKYLLILLSTTALLLNCSLIPSKKPAMNEDFIREITTRERYGVDSTIVALKTEIADKPENPELYRELAIAYRLKGTPRSRMLSLEAINKSIDLNHMNPINYIQRGLTYYAGTFLSEARQDFTHAVQLDPGCFQGWYQLGRLEYYQYTKTLCYTNHLKKAITYFRKAHRINKKDKNTLFKLSFLLMFRRLYYSASKYARKAEIYHPDDPNIHMLLGTLYLKSTKFEKSRSQFQKAFGMMSAEQLEPYMDISTLLDPQSRQLW
jgi:tetratricopeptide (TPR) repeat protein